MGQAFAYARYMSNDARDGPLPSGRTQTAIC
jgi:hypothetical protein